MTTVAVDFDGVIHAYRRGWADGSIYDEPVPGAMEALRILMREYAVFVYTTRDPAQVADWLAGYGFEVVADSPGARHRRMWNRRGQLLVTGWKLPASAYIDDRAVRFLDWEQALRDMAEVVGRQPPG
ncbi:hypothetical protein ACQUSR_32340 [Streptomyces sp. P1-3]|uniref:hypothetical protein n=1 Tax=Streptomyces sp. P1-3 TaxID=3421658 RepID=UPI003D36075E